MKIELHRNDPRAPLIDQIVGEISRAVEEARLRAGDRMPSVRRAAGTWQVSRNSVVEAYERLVAAGYLQSVRGSGFYVRRREPAARGSEPLPRESQEIDAAWMLRQGSDQTRCPHRPGWGSLPNDWLNQAGVRKAIREVGRREGISFTDYGHPAGTPRLREQLSLRLEQIGVHAGPARILTTSGASQALDLVARCLLRAGDTALVDDPGYYTLFALLRTLDVNIVGVPRTPAGPDLRAFEEALATHRPKVYFTVSVLHNPTGTSLSPSCAHQLLRLTEQTGTTVVEDDVYGDFHPEAPLRLAALDGLDRVIYVSSFSKTMASGLRLGYLAANPALFDRILDLKLLSTMTTSVLSEQVVLELLAGGQYRRFLSALCTRLESSRHRLVQRLERLGFEIDADEGRGMYVWARLPEGLDARAVTRQAARRGVMLAPGHVFRPNGEDSSHLRFNVACSNRLETFHVLEDLLRRKAA